MLVGLSIFSFLVLVAFDMFALGSSQFELSNGRLELQGEIRRINGALRRDILTSCFTSISSHSPAGSPFTVPATPPIPLPTVNVTRDTICFASKADPANPVTDPTTGLSMFGAWTIYCPYTNPDNVYDCKLYRYRTPYLPPTGISQLPFAATAPAGTAPGDWAVIMWPPTEAFTDLHCYSNRIRSFQILPNPGDQTMTVTMTLQAPIGRIMTGKKQTAEIVESSIILKSENTWPKL